MQRLKLALELSVSFFMHIFAVDFNSNHFIFKVFYFEQKERHQSINKRGITVFLC